ncbi:MAG: LamG domain-containing protein, partial [bacterium]|nr:LamG domain-containing protein [bacterium]
NDAPVVSAPGSALAATEQVALAIEGTGFGVSDVDEAGSGATATLTTGEGAITVVIGDSGATIDSGNGTGTVVVSGTIAQINSLLDDSSTGTINYLNSSDTPSASTTFTVTVNDAGNTGADPGLTGDGSSEEGTNSQTINITATNDGPTHDDPILTSALGTDTTNEDLTSTPQNTFDADGDAVKNIFNWYKDTNPIQVLNMPFEGGSDGSSTKDYSDSANNGTVDGPTWNATGGHDGKGAYEFDGTNDKIDFGDADPGIGGSSEATWSAWVKPSSVSGVQAIFQKEHNGGWAVFLNNTSMGFWDGGSATQDASLVVGEWAHLVWVFNSGEMEFYKNGLHLGTQSTGSNIINDQAGVNLCIGLKGVNSGEDFSGTIDDIQIFNHSLSAEQIANLSNGDVNIIDSEETTAGETWQSCVTPNDGTVDGTTKCSNNLAIINIAPTGANNTVVTNEDTAHTFTAAAFNYSNGDGDRMARAKITTLEAGRAL